MLTNVFTFPRNHRFDKVRRHFIIFFEFTLIFQVSQTKLKEDIGSYIWRKFGTLGFLVGAQTFKPRQFLQIVSDSLIMLP